MSLGTALSRLRGLLPRAAPRPGVNPVALELARRSPFSYAECARLLGVLAGDGPMADRCIATASACAVSPLDVADFEERRLRAGGDLRPGQSVEAMASDVYCDWFAVRRAAGKAPR